MFDIPTEIMVRSYIMSKFWGIIIGTVVSIFCSIGIHATNNTKKTREMQKYGANVRQMNADAGK